MTTATLDRPTAAMGPRPGAGATSGPATASPRTAAGFVGLMFLTATVTFVVGNALVHSYFSSASPHTGTLVAGVALLGGDGAAVVANGLVTRRALTPRTPVRARAYLVLRAAECLTLVATGVYFLTRQARWDAYVLPVYAVSGAAGLVVSSALFTSRAVPRNLSLLGVIGYPVFLVGSVLAMCSVIDVTHGAGMVALVPGGLFELVLPIWLFAHGFTSHQGEAS